MSDIEVLSEFKTQLVAFLDELIDQFPLEGDLVVVRLFIANQVPILEAMNTFNHLINKDECKLRKMVKDRNELFFLEHDVFDTLGRSKVSHFKKLWRSDNLDHEDKKIIWQWVDTFVYLGDKYIKSQQVATA